MAYGLTDLTSDNNAQDSIATSHANWQSVREKKPHILFGPCSNVVYPVVLGWQLLAPPLSIAHALIWASQAAECLGLESDLRSCRKGS